MTRLNARALVLAVCLMRRGKDVWVIPDDFGRIAIAAPQQQRCIAA